MPSSTHAHTHMLQHRGDKCNMILDSYDLEIRMQEEFTV